MWVILKDIISCSQRDDSSAPNFQRRNPTIRWAIRGFLGFARESCVDLVSEIADVFDGSIDVPSESVDGLCRRNNIRTILFFRLERVPLNWVRSPGNVTGRRNKCCQLSPENPRSPATLLRAALRFLTLVIDFHCFRVLLRQGWPIITGERSKRLRGYHPPPSARPMSYDFFPLRTACELGTNNYRSTPRWR